MPNLRNALLLILALTVAGPLTTALSSCTTAKSRVIAAAETTGKIKAGVDLPDQPDECRKHMDRYQPKDGDKIWAIQAHWELKADAADRQTDDCSSFYSDVKTKFAGK